MPLHRIFDPALRPRPACNEPDLESSSVTDVEESTLSPSTAGDDDVLQPHGSPHTTLQRWAQHTNLLGPVLQRHVAPRFNPYHPDHVAHAQRPYVPSGADRWRTSLAAAGVQVGFGWFGLQVAADQLWPRGPSPFNPGGHRALVPGVLSVAVSVPALVCSGSALANLLTQGVQAAARRDGPLLAAHPRSAAVGGYAVAMGATVGAILGSLAGCAALDARLTGGVANPAVDGDVGALAGLLLTLSATLVPTTGWYLGQLLGAGVGHGAARLRGGLTGAGPGPIALD